MRGPLSLRAGSRRTKILATVGPATSSTGRLRALIRAGVDGLRINFSHGTQPEHRSVIRRIRQLAASERRELALVADLQGPKVRLGDLAGSSVVLREGSQVRLDGSNRPGTATRLSVLVPDLSHAARIGDPVLLGDGIVELRVERTTPSGLEAVVVHGGTVHSRQGIYLPRARLRASVLGPKDLVDLRVALEEEVDFIALSFVRDAADIRLAQRRIRALRSEDHVRLIAKIERAQALERIEEILPEVEGVMVARGDLGIEVPLERLALEQKRIVRLANSSGRIAIVATQMLLSMVTSPRPSRAEATDVANAILDGADVVMLSEESAVGQYPIEAVRWMDRIARATESAIDHSRFRAAGVASGLPPVETAVSDAAVQTAEALDAAAIVVPTHSGRTARLVSRLRPQVPLLALSAQPGTRRRLALVWGVEARPSPPHLSLEGLRNLAGRIAARGRPDRPARPVVLTAGYPIEGRPTNLLTVTETPRRASPHRR